MKFCNRCGAELADAASFCPKCGAPQAKGAPAPRPAGTGESLRFSSWNMASVSEYMEIVIILLFAVWMWSVQSDLPGLLFAREKMAVRLFCIVLVLLVVPFAGMNILRRKQVYLVLEENGVSGIWLRREWSIFLITVEPFRIAYSEIEETKVKGMGTGSLFLKVRGQWKPVPVERGREVKERIDRRRAAG